MFPVALSRTHGGHYRRVLIATLAAALLMTVAFATPASADEEAAPAAVPATIVVQKVTVGGDGVFSYTSGTLTPGAFELSTRAGSAARTFDDLAPGTYDVAEAPLQGWNLASATCSNGDSPSAITVAAGDAVTCTFAGEIARVAPRGAITIEKATNGQDADTPTGPEVIVGDPITWTYVITNTGDVALSNVVVSDDQIGEVCSFDRLKIGASETCTATGIAQLGQYANVGSVVGHYGYEGETATAADPSHYIGFAKVTETPGIDIEKATNGEDADTPTGPEITIGDTVTWTYVVTNTGNVDLTNVVVTDDIIGAVCSFDYLAVGAAETCEKTGTATLGQYGNVGTVTGSHLEKTVTDKDPSHYVGVPVDAPAIRIVKDVDPAVITVGVATEVTWTIRVTNIGNVPLHDVVVTDALVPACDKEVGDLAVAGHFEYECTSRHTPDSVTWSFTNTAVVTGYGPDGTKVTDTDPAAIVPVGVEGTAQLGDTVWWDANKNGVQDNGEKGINGARITLKDADGTAIASTTTAKGPWDGWYKFVGLDAGTYTATIDMSSVKSTYTLTTPGSFTIALEEGEDYLDADFGLYEPQTTSTTTTTTQPPETLPDTGIDSGVLVVTAVSLLTLGGLVVLATRRREPTA